MNKKTEPYISVIVPVFNTARFLEKCITSIINQTIYDLQIILIDDGSTDESGAICDKFAERDDRIMVIHQVNAGVSAARNAGLREAIGRYIAFADSDDVLPEDAYEILLNKMTIQSGLIMGRMQRISEYGEFLDESTEFDTETIGREAFIKELFEEKKLSYLGFLWDKLFLREVIEKNDLSFHPAIALNEDRLFLLQYMLQVQTVLLDHHIVYYYRQRSNGVVTATRRNVTVTDSEMTVLRSFREMQKICRSYSEELYFICSRKAFESALDLLNRVSKEDIQKQKVLKVFLNENSKICLKNPQYGFFERLKIIGHTILCK
ncbi:MAG: glycosyltransferase [Lachnospiraceae bacterium]